MSRKITRRRFIQGTLASAGLTLAACASGTPEPTKAPAPPAAAQPTKAPAPTAAPAATKASEPTKAPAAAAPAATKAPAAAPTSFSEAPSLAQLVKSGKLPSLDKRLPEKPYVNKDAPEIGTYSAVCTLPHESTLDIPVNYWITGEYSRTAHIWNESLTQFVADETLTELGASEKTTIEPNLAESWTWSADGKEITFNLRKGVKWSDGQPFTVDDILFTWNDVAQSDAIISPQATSVQKTHFSPTGYHAKAGGIPVFTKVDDFTLKVTFKNPYPESLARFFSQNAYYGLYILPKHQMEKLHPKLTPGATMEQWNGARFPKDKPPVLMPWIPSGVVGDKLFCERNPYYWKVDNKGQQLPYFDRFVFKSAKLGSEVAMGLISGELDGDYTKAVAQEAATVKRYEKTAGVRLLQWDFPKAWYGQGLRINLDTPKDGLRALFQNQKFTQALALGLDTDGMGVKTCAVCPAWKSPFSPAFFYYNEYKDKYVAKFDRAAAMKIFDELGLKDTNGDGYREYPAGGPQAGEPIGWLMPAPAHDWNRVRWGEDATEQLNQMGFKVTFSPMDEQVAENTLVSPGLYEMYSTGAAIFGGAYTKAEDLQKYTGAGLLPQKEGDPNPLLPRSKDTKLFDWQIEGQKILADFKANPQDKAARDKLIDWVVSSTYRWRMAFGAVSYVVAINERIGNNPYLYNATIGKRGFFDASWDAYQAMRTWQWYRKA